MSSTVEKNDVDLSKLFYYGDKFIIKDRKGKEVMTAFIRLVGDSELNRARVFALRCSAELRGKLKDKESDEHKAYILDNYDEFSNEALIEMISSYSYQKLAKEAMDLVSLPIPVEPKSDAPLEEMENYQKEVDEYPLKRMTAIKMKLDELLGKYKDNLKSKNKNLLIKEYETNFINAICEQEMIDKFREMCTYFGAYKDKHYKERIFSEFEDFTNLPAEIKQQFIDAYSKLDLPTQDLKK